MSYPKLVTISFSLSGEQQAVARLGLAADVIGDLRPVWRETAHPWLLDHMEQQFGSAGRHGGKPWDGYHSEPKYAAYKRAMVGHLDVLRWQKGGPFEWLYPSLTKRLHHSQVFIAKPSSMAFGTAVPHAKRLTKGGIGPFGERYKGRDIMAMSNGQRRNFIRAIQRDIVSRVSRETLRTARVS